LYSSGRKKTLVGILWSFQAIMKVKVFPQKFHLIFGQHNDTPIPVDATQTVWSVRFHKIKRRNN
jgi:hypothetical protein